MDFIPAARTPFAPQRVMMTHACHDYPDLPVLDAA